MNMGYMMEDEIKSQTTVIQNLIDEHIINYCIKADIPSKIQRIKIIASGSSYNAACFGKIFFESIAQVEANVEFASEFSNSDFLAFDTETLYVFISQSGNSYDTVACFNRVKDKGAKTLCITNNKDSQLYQNCDYKFYLNAGEEKAIAATKTFSASVFMLWLIAVKISQNKHLNSIDEIKNIHSLVSSIESTFNDVENIDVAVNIISKQKGFPIVGFGPLHALSREAALKIKEINYINTCSYPLGEFIHGHFAILNKAKILLVFLLGQKSEFELKALDKILSSYKVRSILVSDEYMDNCDVLVKIPPCRSRIATLICAIIFIQLLTLSVAKKLKRNIDKPKGLKKIVK